MPLAEGITAGATPPAISFADGALGVFDASVGRLISFFTSPSNSFSVGPVIITVLFALFFTYREARKTGGDRSLKAIFRKAFPKEIYTHKSARHDYLIFVLNEGVFFWFSYFAALAVIIPVGQLLPQASESPVFENRMLELLLLSILVIFITDFLSTFSHYLRHKIPFLWEFHKVHHSAEVLVPATVYRRHPVELIVNGIVATGGTAISVLLWSAIFRSTMTPAEIFGVNFGVFFWRMLFYNLRHSHIWIDYGPFWSRIFTSPAQHQLHHSADPKHYDCNFGVIFAFWDILFGTLYVPKEKEDIKFGLSPADMKDFESLSGIYLNPFRNAFALFRKQTSVQSRSETVNT